MTSRGFSWIAGICAALAAWNIISFTGSWRDEHTTGRLPLHSLMYKFTGLEKALSKVRYAGYVTDKNIEEPFNLAQFELAQYVIAPTVLVLNKTDLPVVLLDFSSPQAALDKIKELKLKPLSSNAGIILAVDPSLLP